MSIKSINPANQELLAEFDMMSWEEVENKIQKANESFNKFKNTSFEERKALMHKLGDIMEANIEELAKLDSLEMWMLYKDALWDVKKSVSNVRFFADNAEKYLADKRFDEEWVKWKIVYQPLWAIFSVMPWNFPYNQVLRSVVPNIMAGNVVLMKHASNVPQVAQKIEDLFIQAWFEEGIYTNLFIPHDFTEKIVAHKHIIWANVTGSEMIWRKIWELAGKNLKPSVLELGGNDAFVVLDTDDVDTAVSCAIKWRFSNHGQKCNSSKRFIVVDSVYEEFKEKFVSKVKSMKVWDPFDESSDIGPLAKASAVDEIHRQVSETLDKWADLLAGGEKLEWNWNYYLPTVLENVSKDSPAYKEEIFGPVAPLIKVADVDEAIQVINDSEFGLGCSVYGDSKEDKMKVAMNSDVANVFIDGVVTSFANLPYGWIKNTGYGKELGEAWLKAFVNEKVIVES